jgi:hypothetical protein
MKKRALRRLVAAAEDDDDDDDDNNACDDHRDAFVALNHRTPHEHSDAYDEDHRHRVSSSDVATSSGWPRKTASFSCHYRVLATDTIGTGGRDGGGGHVPAIGRTPG